MHHYCSPATNPAGKGCSRQELRLMEPQVQQVHFICTTQHLASNCTHSEQLPSSHRYGDLLTRSLLSQVTSCQENPDLTVNTGRSTTANEIDFTRRISFCVAVRKLLWKCWRLHVCQVNSLPPGLRKASWRQ